jgi:hypothetical protein
MDRGLWVLEGERWKFGERAGVRCEGSVVNWEVGKRPLGNIVVRLQSSEFVYPGRCSTVGLGWAELGWGSAFKAST